ncbi:replication stress response regulator SDE2 [Diabrotica virgifera virgifera]|uniref:SDE2-like domain-containing protein n=1 Tax=Diabrotica virgifera virgifera TaxID=50390 RepID=A0ABM5KKN0_DIAVI|nr:replication stress response regulator SDE2 [Diabrotica virgifera virgifera]
MNLNMCNLNNTMDNNSLEVTGDNLKNKIEAILGWPVDSFYLTLNGRIVQSDTIVQRASIDSLRIIPRIFGGKGGFGSMLRAIGAQIEKTTNREACRDLSGRRLRDINEEQRLKNWINQQAEREKEAKERKKKKLEKMCEQPKYEFNDSEYDKERSALPEMVEDAVLQGLQATSSTSDTSMKRKGDKKEVIKKKKAKLWVDDELDEDLSSEDDSSGNESSNESKNGELNIEKSAQATRSDNSLEDVPNSLTPDKASEQKEKVQEA